MAALFRVVRALRRDYATDIAAAEQFGVLLGAHGVAIGDPVDRCGAESGNGTEDGTEPAAAQHEPPAARRIADALPLARQGEVGADIGARDAAPRDGELGKFPDGKDAERHGNPRNGGPRIEVAE